MLLALLVRYKYCGNVSAEEVWSTTYIGLFGIPFRATKKTLGDFGVIYQHPTYAQQRERPPVQQ